MGKEARLYADICTEFRNSLRYLEFEEILLPSLWEQQTFIDKGGPEIINQMYAFKDKGDRDICLIPECTALVQKMWNEEWKKEFKSLKVFYIQRCYRYERPQAGRYREFTQVGIEILGESNEDTILSLKYCLDKFNIPYTLNDSVKRGLSYYVENGFEAEVSYLGAQKQIAGGGKYAEGIGWAVGVDRLMLAIQNKDNPDAIGKNI